MGCLRKLREVVVQPYVHHLLRQASEKRSGHFTVVQIGANDGVHSDPVSKIAKELGWQGLLIEPNPDNFSLLRQTYREHPQIRLEQAAITTQDGVVVLHRPKQLPDGRSNPLKGKDTLHVDAFENIAWMAPDWAEMIEAIEVPALTLASVLDKHQLYEYDFLTVDTEGHDKIILDQLDLAVFRPSFIQFEFVNLTPADLEELKSRLRSHGYRLLPLRWDIFAYLRKS